MTVHPTAIVEDGATLGADVVVGPFCRVGGSVVLGNRVVLRSHVVVDGRTRVGDDTVIEPFAVVGLPAQVAKRENPYARLEIGARCHIREHATLNTGYADEALTKVGDDCLLMIATHVAHDCRVGEGVVMTHNSTLAGHVTLGDGVILGGGSAVHQFVRVGEGAFVGGLSGIEFDLIPFGMATGNRARVTGLNLVGLKRRNFPRASIHALRHAVKDLFDPAHPVAANVERVAAAHAGDALVEKVVAFIREGGRRRLLVPADRGRQVARADEVE